MINKKRQSLIMTGVFVYERFKLKHVNLRTDSIYSIY